MANNGNVSHNVHEFGQDFIYFTFKGGLSRTTKGQPLIFVLIYNVRVNLLLELCLKFGAKLKEFLNFRKNHTYQYGDTHSFSRVLIYSCQKAAFFSQLSM